MINLEGFTVCAASEVKSRAHAWKVYHTGTAFYFAAHSQQEMLGWIRALAAHALRDAPYTQLDISQQFSETDYSDTESDNENSERRERERESREQCERDRDRDRDKDKSKFGSLKKLTGRMQRSESSDNVGHSTSLDRKYLRFFSRHKNKDESKPSKIKQPVPIPTEQYRSYRRAPSPATAGGTGTAIAAGQGQKASPPPAPAPAPAPAPPSIAAPRQLTLEELMLAEQDTRQMYTDRVVLGVQTDLQRRLDSVVPDVVYSQLPTPGTQNRSLSRTDRPRVPRSSSREARITPSTAKDGQEKCSPPVSGGGDAPPSVESPHERWRDSLRRNHKVHSAQHKPSPSASPSGASWGGANTGAAPGGVSRLRLVFGAAPQYPHLQCPPTFQPESYSLARLAPTRAPPAPPS
ncbi:unnamed protein product [Chilo suppressalis]|uniref:PH domain-containing protein n=1 Tax=Chilo suppressalis TaxID=168631 RepID=A0ABN8BK82_CHISP|nr:unnamed protein product [Chilo suppressalis]